VLLTIEVIKSGKCSSYKNVKQAIALDEGLKNDSETLIRLMISEANSPKIEKAIFFECIARQLSPSCAGLFFIFGMLSNCLRTKEYDLKDLICNLCEENKKNILIDLLIAEETYELYKINNNYDPSVCSIALNKTQLLDDYNAILDTAHALKIG
ncbi:MAG: hypothetical protein HAW67_04425, partial [Endozoicomonadaceae bacterium]|nr:hypothetical protein [Endozoicomonadaceae bacterium]